MTNRHSDISVAKTDTDRAPARQRVADTLQAAAVQLQDTGLKEDLARLFREDPHQAERDLRDAVAGLARGLLGQAFAARDDHGDRLQIDGKSTRQVAASSGQATTLFGTVTFPRARSRPSGAGPSVVSTEQVLGLTTGGMTPAAAGLSAAIMASLPARDGADLWQRICGAGPATRSLIRLTAEVGQEFEDQADDLLEEVRAMRAGMMMRWPCGSRWMARCCGCLRKSGMDRFMNMAGVRPPAALWPNRAARGRC